MESFEAACCEKNKVSTAFKALKALTKKAGDDSTRRIDQDSQTFISLQISFKKIQIKSFVERKIIALPHCFFPPSMEICLIVSDLDREDKRADNDETKRHYQAILDESGIPTANWKIDIMPLRVLRTEYSAFEAKRNLVAAYDLFIADRRIAAMLPRILGSKFFAKNKLPLRVDVSDAYMFSKTFRKTISSTVFTNNGSGATCSMKIGNLSLLSGRENVENILAAAEYLMRDKQVANISSVYLRSAKSAVPLYLSFGSHADVPIEAEQEKPGVKDSVSTLSNNCQVVVLSDGRVHIKTTGDALRPEEVSLLTLQNAEIRHKRIERCSRGRVRRLLLRGARLHHNVKPPKRNATPNTRAVLPSPKTPARVKDGDGMKKSAISPSDSQPEIAKPIEKKVVDTTETPSKKKRKSAATTATPSTATTVAPSTDEMEEVPLIITPLKTPKRVKTDTPKTNDWKKNSGVKVVQKAVIGKTPRKSKGTPAGKKKSFAQDAANTPSKRVSFGNVYIKSF